MTPRNNRSITIRSALIHCFLVNAAFFADRSFLAKGGNNKLNFTNISEFLKVQSIINKLCAKIFKSDKILIFKFFYDIPVISSS